MSVPSLGGHTFVAQPMTAGANSAERSAREKLQWLSYSRESHQEVLRATLNESLRKTIEGMAPELPISSQMVDCKTFMEEGASRLAHIVCDGFVRESRLEGSSCAETVTWLLENLDLFSPGHPIAADLRAFAEKARELRTAAHLPSLADKYAAAIKALKPGDRLLLPGGWHEVPFGHFMLYEFKKQPDGRYTFNIYNSGAGSRLFHTLLFSRGKALVGPLLSFQNIPLRDLFLGDENNSGYIQALLEVCLTERHIGSFDNAQLIYKDLLLNNFESFLSPPATFDFATPQRSGTCGYSTLIAFLRTQMPSLDEFKALQIKIKVHELSKAFMAITDLAAISAEGYAARYLLQKGAEWLLSRLIKAYRKSGERALLRQIATVNHILNAVKGENIEAERLITKAKGAVEVTPRTFKEVFDYKAPTAEMKAVMPACLPERPKALILRDLDTFKVPFESFLQSNPELAKVWGVSFVDALPRPQDIKPDEASLASMQQINEIISLLVKAYQAIHKATAEERLALFKLFALQHALAVALDKPPGKVFLANFACAPLFAESIWQLRFMDEIGRAKFLDLQQYFTKFNEGKKNVVIAWELSLCTTDQFYRELFAHFPALKTDFGRVAEGDEALIAKAKCHIRDSAPLFERRGLLHFSLLRETALTAYNAMRTSTSNNDLHEGPFGGHLAESGLYLGQPSHKSFFASLNNAVFILPNDASTHEAAYLCQAVKSSSREVENIPADITPIIYELLRASFSQEIFCHLILEVVTNNLALLSHDLVRELFEYYFFEPQKILDKTLLKKRLFEDTALLSLTKKFVKDGINHFFTRRYDQPELPPLLFVLDFAQRITMLQKEAGLPMTEFPLVDPCMANLDARLDTFSSIPIGSRFFLEQLKLQSYLFGEKPIDPTAFCSAWVRYNWLDKQANGRYTRHPLRTILYTRCYDVLAMIAAGATGDLIKGVLQKLGLPPLREPVVYKHPLIFSSGSFKADLINSQIDGCQGECIPRFYDTLAFKGFFGPEAVVFKETARGVEFDHSLGHFIICEGDLNKLYADFPGFGCGSYLSPFVMKALPEGLIYDHRHYLLPDGRILITDAKNRPYLLIQKNGAIIAVDHPDQTLSCVKTGVELPEFTFLVGETLSFPRLSLEGEPVVFKKGVATFDERYAIDLSPLQGRFGLFTNYLYLCHRNGGKDKILVPFLSLNRPEFPTTETRLKIKPPEEEKKSYNIQTEGTIPCFTFTIIEKGSLKSENNAGSLYLVLLALQRKVYDEALVYLDEVNRAEPLDLSTICVLNMILKHEDSHPNSLAIILKAATLSNIMVVEPLECYLDALNKVSVSYRLPLNELLDLLRRAEHKSPLCHSWLIYLTTGSWPQVQSNLQTNGAADNDFKLTELEKGLVSSWAQAMKGYSEASLKTNIYTSFIEGIADRAPWLTQITLDTWKGFFVPAFAIAVQGSPVQKKLLNLQLRCSLHNPKSTLKVEQKLLLKILMYVLGESPGVYRCSRDSRADFYNLIVLFESRLKTAFVPYTAQISRKSNAIVEEPFFRPYSPVPLLRRAHPTPLVEKKDILDLCDLPSVDDYFTVNHNDYAEEVPTASSLKLSPEEELYRPHVESSVEAFCDEIRKGQEALKKALHYKTERQEDLKRDLMAKRKALEDHDKNLTIKLLEKANKTRFVAETLELEANGRPAITIETLYYLFLQQSEEAFLYENPSLEGEVPELMQMCFESLQIKTSLQHIDRIQKALDDNDADKAGGFLATKRQYEPLLSPHYLVFEYFSDVRLYKSQVALLTDLQKDAGISKIGQLMMGGGKTKVLSALLLFAAAKPGVLPLLIVPNSLYQVVYTDLNRSLKNNFNRMVYPLQFTRQELTEARCLAIEEKISYAMLSGQVVLVKAEALQTLRLQYLFELEQALEEGLGLSAKGIIIGRILQIIHKQSDTLIDEAHHVLAQKQEVNFPVGQKKLVDGAYIDLVERLFRLLMDDPRVGLLSDKQMLLKDEVYKRDIVPSLIAHYPLPAGYSAAEIGRYLRGESAKDVEAKLAREPQRQVAHSLALARYLINELFPKAFKRSCGRHFGPLPTSMAQDRGMVPGKIVPYLAVGTPATTVFASWAEEAIYGFMTVCREEVSAEQLDFIINAAKSQLKEEVDVERLNKKMAELTGFTLFDIESKENRKRALATINSDSHRKLRAQGEFLKLTITYYDKRFSSNPQDWELPIIRGLSGTPYNRLCYTGGLSLDEHFVPDPAVEGKIVAALLKKARALHVTKTTDPKALLESLLSKSDRSRVRGLQDPGGLFKGQDNLEVAKAFNEVIEPLEGTLFFWKKPGMAAADQIAFLRRGSDTPIALKGSSRKDLEEQGINPDKIFIYFDERRTTGTDLPQPPDAINFTTIDVLQDITATLQSVLRLRQLVTGQQEIEFVIPEDRYAEMPPDLSGIIIHMVKNLAIDQSKQLYQALCQRIDSYFKKAALKALLDCSPTAEEDTRIALYQKLRPLLVENAETDLFTAYGTVPDMVNPEEALKGYIQHKKALYRSCAVDLKIPDDLYTLLGVNPKALATKVISPCHLEEGTQVEMAQDVAQQVEQEVQQQTQIQQELLKELAEYQVLFDVKTEDPFPLDAFLIAGEARPAAFSQTLSASMANCLAYRQPYGQCFGDEICVTSNFAPQYPTHPMAIFNKQHKPAHQILVEKKAKGSLTFTFISLAEADLIKKSLPPAAKHLWLIDHMGDYLLSLTEGQEDIREAPAFKRALIQAAAFNGDAQYLEKHKEETESWLAENHSLQALKKRLITMKAQNEPLQARVIALSSFNVYHVPLPPEAVVTRHQVIAAPLPSIALIVPPRAPAPLPALTPQPSPAAPGVTAPGPATPQPSPAASRTTAPGPATPQVSPTAPRVTAPGSAAPPAPPTPPPPSAPAPRTLAFRIGFGLLSLLTMPFAFLGLLFTLPFSRRPFLEFWHWFKRPFS